MKTVLITGAASGIGLQLAKDYAEAGWHVIACARHLEQLDCLLSYPTLTPCEFDVTDRQQIAQSLDTLGTLSDQSQSIDLAILNAGTCEYIDDAKQFDAELFERIIRTNVIGTANCMPAILSRMQRGSRIALVSSAVTLLPLTRSEAYGASKAAIDYLARSLAVDLDKSGIAVSLIRPGFVDTPLTQRNDFPMPGRVSVEAASRFIRQGLALGKREIAFPFLFILTMRLLSWLPQTLWHRISVNMARDTA